LPAEAAVQEEEEMDEEAILEQAKLLSMQQEAAQQQPNLGESQFADIMDNEFVGQIVKDLNLNLNNEDINELLNQVNKGDQAKEEQKKKEEEDKKQ